MPGFDLSRSDRSSIAAKYMCACCKLLLRDAMQTGCGHFYCFSCLFDSIGPETPSSTVTCMQDGKTLTCDEVFPDIFLRREISQLVVHCTFAEQGCKWKGKVKHLETHTKTCEFLHVLSCINSECSMVVKRSALKEQEKIKECKGRLQKCANCKKDAKLNPKEMREHLDPLLGDCDAVRGPCPFAEAGCQERDMSRSQRNRHLQKHAVYHNSLLLEMALNLSRDVESLMWRNPRLLVRNLDFVAECQKTISDILSQVQGVIKEQRKPKEEIQAESERRDVAGLGAVAEFTRQQQASSNDGVLLWIITDFAKRKNDAISGKQQSFDSPCFYTSVHGYKMCARIYLNGDDMGRGTHISVFIVVMRGEYDALLRWPFRQKVTIMLLDQDNVEHVIDAFRPDPKSFSFQRPRREMNAASGFPLFCFLAELAEHAYVRDDNMFIKVLVDTSDL